jgi:hypothetical protein
MEREENAGQEENPGTPLDRMREVERRRGREKRIRRRRLVLSLALLGAVLGVLGLYITLPARLSETVDQYRFELVRPELGPFMRVAVAAVLAGGLLAAFIGRIASSGTEKRHSPMAWVFYGALYGLVIPFATGAFIPTSGVIIDLLLGRSPWRGLAMRLFYAVFGTPVFAAVYGILGFYIGLISGVILAAAGWGIDRLNGSENKTAARWGPLSLAALCSIVIAMPVLFGPFELFKHLVTMWGSR